MTGWVRIFTAAFGLVTLGSVVLGAWRSGGEAPLSVLAAAAVGAGFLLIGTIGRMPKWLPGGKAFERTEMLALSFGLSIALFWILTKWLLESLGVTMSWWMPIAPTIAAAVIVGKWLPAPRATLDKNDSRPTV